MHTTKVRKQLKGAKTTISLNGELVIPERYSPGDLPDILPAHEVHFPTMLHANKYLVDISAILIPGPDLMYFGVSVCSPHDCNYYDNARGRAQSLGRAKQTAIEYLCHLPITHTLVEGFDGPATLKFDDHIDLIRAIESDWLAKLAEYVAESAELTAASKEIRAIFQAHPHINLRLIMGHALDIGRKL